MKLTVVGSGYVGLVTAACFSFAGHDVLCVEKDKKKISSIKKGNLPFYEPNLENLVKEGIKNGRLIFSTDLSLINEFSESVFICVGTPSNPDGSANINYVKKSLKQILLIDNSKLEDIVIKSTVPPGTADRLSSEICEKEI
jgi:UDPglucose 6-dehydrogenase